MTGDQIPSLIMQIVDELRAHGVLITNRAGDASIFGAAPTRRPISPMICKTLSNTAALWLSQDRLRR
jgi:hypothetical protein